MDEFGRGFVAGSFVLAAVIPGNAVLPGVRDSTKLTQNKRQILDLEIRSWAKGIGLGVVSNNEIDEFGLAKAITIGANRTLENLKSNSVKAHTVLLDGHYDFICNSDYSVRTIIKGDNVSHAIAAASIIAKVYRDNYMSSKEVTDLYPEFSFEKNKGYPAPVHKKALTELGPTPLHRISWNIFGDSFLNDRENALF